MLYYPYNAITSKTISQFRYNLYSAISINMLKYNHDSSATLRLLSSLIDSSCEINEDLPYQFRFNFKDFEFVNIDRLNGFSLSSVDNFSKENQEGKQLYGYSRYTNEYYPLEIIKRRNDLIRHSLPTGAFFSSMTIVKDPELSLIYPNTKSNIGLKVEDSSITIQPVSGFNFLGRESDSPIKITIFGLDTFGESIEEEVLIESNIDYITISEFSFIDSAMVTGANYSVEIMIYPYIRGSVVVWNNDYIDRDTMDEYNTVLTVNREAHQLVFNMLRENPSEYPYNYEPVKTVDFNMPDSEIIIAEFIDVSNKLIYISSENDGAFYLRCYPLVVPKTNINTLDSIKTTDQSVRIECLEDCVGEKFVLWIFPTSKSNDVDFMHIFIDGKAYKQDILLDLIREGIETNRIEIPFSDIIPAPPDNSLDIPPVVLDNPNAYGSESGDMFGGSVDMCDSYIIAGASREDDPNGSSSGKAYIYNKETGALIHTLNNPSGYGGSNEDYFGYAVGICESYSVVGAYYEDDPNGTYAGKAYIFDNVTGELLHVLNNPNAIGDSSYFDLFGSAVSICESYCVIGAHGESEDSAAGLLEYGTAYLFNNKTGSLLHQLVNPATKGRFGQAVSVCESYSLIGASMDSTNGTWRGSAHIFSNTTGELLNTIGVPDSIFFGQAVSICESYSLIGASDRKANGVHIVSDAYLFKNTTGELVHTIKNPRTYNEDGSDRFSYSVSVCESYSLIGASGTDGESGKAYLYNNKTAELVRLINNPNASGSEAGDKFGGSISICESGYVIAAIGEGSGGQAYAYKLLQPMEDDNCALVEVKTFGEVQSVQPIFLDRTKLTALWQKSLDNYDLAFKDSPAIEALEPSIKSSRIQYTPIGAYGYGEEGYGGLISGSDESFGYGGFKEPDRSLLFKLSNISQVTLDGSRIVHVFNSFYYNEEDDIVVTSDTITHITSNMEMS